MDPNQQPQFIESSESLISDYVSMDTSDSITLEYFDNDDIDDDVQRQISRINMVENPQTSEETLPMVKHEYADSDIDLLDSPILIARSVSGVRAILRQREKSKRSLRSILFGQSTKSTPPKPKKQTVKQTDSGLMIEEIPLRCDAKEENSRKIGSCCTIM